MFGSSPTPGLLTLKSEDRAEVRFSRPRPSCCGDVLVSRHVGVTGGQRITLLVLVL